MKRLWAPWRFAYIAAPAVTACVLCEAPASGDDRAVLILHRAQDAYLILNRFPYNTGHLMAVPFGHLARPDELTPREAEALMALVSLGVRALELAMEPDGFNIGMNLGRAAGAGIADHLHLHIVPRWSGDTNFMPVLGGVKVLPEHLDDTYQRLATALASLVGPDTA
ncbi:MAG: HIT domain-containing protein [bacterium]|nr:HIT domain-containing protein [bacterium]